MPNYIVDGTALTNIANAIRTKGGTSASLAFPQGFIDAINAISGGGSIMQTITIDTATNTCKDSYDAIQAKIGNDVNWIAVVNDSSYITGGGDKIVAVVGCSEQNERKLYRNDSNHGYMYVFNYGTNVGKIPAGTDLEVFVFPAQPSAS